VSQKDKDIVTDKIVFGGINGLEITVLSKPDQFILSGVSVGDEDIIITYKRIKK